MHAFFAIGPIAAADGATEGETPAAGEIKSDAPRARRAKNIIR
jgi:hypothetical protein